MFYAKLAHFYGWTHDEVERLSFDMARQYFEAISVIKAQDNLITMNIADYPRMKDGSRRDFHRAMHRQANPAELSKISTTDDVFRMLNGKRN